MVLAGGLAFRRARTTVNPLQPQSASSLVRGGIYSRTRNPMYLGFALVLLGWVVALGSWLGLLVLAGYVVFLNRFQIRPEERALEAIFGPTFLEYRDQVRRWI